MSGTSSEFYTYEYHYFAVSPGLSQTFTMVFAPQFSGVRTCTLYISGGCPSVPLTGVGLPEPPEVSPSLALHVSPPTASGCADAPTSPCSDYVTEWLVGQPATVWLVAAHGPPEGVGGLTCGILYEGSAVGGETRHNGIGVDVDDWTLCASGLQLISGGSSPEDEWPASGGGIRLTWDTTTDCQTTALGDDGIHAIAGYFTVYAYSPDHLDIAPNYNVSAGPEFSVTDCNEDAFDLIYPQAAGAVGFGDAQGYNPCSQTPVCSLSRTSLDIGAVEVGQYSSASFVVTNRGGDGLPVTISEDHQDFLVGYGSTSFSLPGGASRAVTVRFTPRTVGAQTCTVSVSGGCSDVVVTGEGVAPSFTGQEAGVIAVHATIHNFKSSDCSIAPEIPCSEYVTEWPVGVSADIWLVAVSRSLPGIGALSCGIRYDNGAEGGETMTNGIGVDLYEWTLCASGLEFPNCITGSPADEWPASGGGNRITWDASADCQTTEFGGDGIHAVAGFFYVYAYSPDLFEIIVNQGVEPTHAGTSDRQLQFQRLRPPLSRGGGSGRVRRALGLQPLRRKRPRPPALLHRRAGGRRRYDHLDGGRRGRGPRGVRGVARVV